MIRVYYTHTGDTEYFDSMADADYFVKEECISYNQTVTQEEYIFQSDYEIDEYFRCGYCGEEMSEGRYCSKDCSDADNTEGV